MHVIKDERDETFVIERGGQYFSFLVDDDRAHWSIKPWQAYRFDSWVDAEVMIDELRERAKIRRAAKSC